MLLVLWAGVRIVAGINFDRYCTGYLKRAADANTIELARQNLQVALSYIEVNNLINGFTSIIYREPSEDIGFWYQNLTASLRELHKVDPDASQLEKSNILIKLRETLLDQGQSTDVTVPQGISVYPENGFYAMWGLISSIGAIICWLLFCLDDNYY